MSIPQHRTQVIDNTSSCGRTNLAAMVTLETSNKITALAKARNITKGGLAREILTRIAERPDLLAAVLPERS